MSALMSDVLEERVAPLMANAAVNAGGKMLKAIELQYRFGVPGQDGVRVLDMVGDPAPQIQAKVAPQLARKAELEAELARINAEMV